METITYNKLVRDNVPDIIRANGGTCKTKTVKGEELRTALREKLCEEVAEFLAAKASKSSRTSWKSSTRSPSTLVHRRQAG